MGSDRAAGAQVWEENGSVLGWTCGNMVAPAIEAARFFYDLLSPHAPEAQRILHADSVAVMTTFQVTPTTMRQRVHSCGQVFH